MLTFKKIDWVVQLVLIAGSVLVYTVFRYSFSLAGDFIGAYAVVGGWQTLSFIIHFFFPSQAKIPLRKVYLILVLLTIVAGIFFGAVADDDILVYFFGILFWTPCLAVFYLVICKMEIKKLQDESKLKWETSRFLNTDEKV